MGYAAPSAGASDMRSSLSNILIRFRPILQNCADTVYNISFFVLVVADAVRARNSGRAENSLRSDVRHSVRLVQLHDEKCYGLGALRKKERYRRALRMRSSIETADAHAFFNDTVGEISLNDIAEVCRVAIEGIVELVMTVLVIDALCIRGNRCGLHRSCRR